MTAGPAAHRDYYLGNIMISTTSTIDNSTNVTGATLMIYTDVKVAANALLTTPGTRLIVQPFRNPARHAAILCPDAAWADTATLPEQYRGLIATVLENAAKSILKSYVSSYSLQPSTIPAALFTPDAIMSEAAGNNTEWLSKEELTAAWETSATRKQWITDSRYASMREFREVVNYYADLIKKLSGKTSAYKPEDLDLIVAKLRSEDHDTELGMFVLRRVDQLRNRKDTQAPAMNLDLL